jgi:hypothetical protein
MSSKDRLEQLLRQYDTLTLFSNEVEEPEEEEQCIFAKQFEAYLRPVCQEALRNASHISINECYLEAFKKYMEWRNVVLESVYQQLRVKELSLPTPKLYLPPAILAQAAPSLPPPPLFPDVCIDDPA